MPVDTELTETDEGKRVVTADGDEIGKITTVRNNIAAVNPDPGLTGQLRSALGWGSSDTESHRLQSDDVSEITTDTVVVHSDIRD